MRSLILVDLLLLLLLCTPALSERVGGGDAPPAAGGGHLPKDWRWDAYHSHDELAALMKSLGEEYGENVKVYSIGTRQGSSALWGREELARVRVCEHCQTCVCSCSLSLPHTHTHSAAPAAAPRRRAACKAASCWSRASAASAPGRAARSR